MGTARAWIVYLIAALAYASAILQRTTLGAVGLEATERFMAPAGIVSVFAVMQLAVYAAMQIPAGVVLDRRGTRFMVTLGSAIMAAGQLLMSQADTLTLGVIARVLVGVGDACIFTAVIRLIPAWFPSRHVPVLTQVTNVIGQLGQIGSSVGFVYLHMLHGWEAAFLAAAGIALLMTVASAVGIQDTPEGSFVRSARDDAPVVPHIRAAWRHPGTRMGFWAHFSSCFPTLVFVMMWGYAYLVDGEGRPAPVAGSLMTVYVLTLCILGPVVGALAARHRRRRFHIGLTLNLLAAASWLLVLLWPGPAPLPVLVILAVGVGLDGPATALAFDFPRTYAPAERLGTATGVTNIGGFVAGLASILIIGVVLDALSGGAVGGGYTLGQMRLAMSTQFIIMAIGFIGLLVTYRRLRRWVAEHGMPT